MFSIRPITAKPILANKTLTDDRGTIADLSGFCLHALWAHTVVS